MNDINDLKKYFQIISSENLDAVWFKVLKNSKVGTIYSKIILKGYLIFVSFIFWNK